MKFPKKVDIDVNEDFYDRIKVKQNDTARYLLFNLLDNGVPFDLENKTVRVYGLKPDGTKVFNNLTIINAARGLAELQLTTQMLVKPGCLKLELVIYEATDILSTTKFDIDIISCLRDDAAIESTNEFSALTLGLSKLDEWDKYFKETSGKIEEKYTERLNGIDSSLEDTTRYVKCSDLGLQVMDNGENNFIKLKDAVKRNVAILVDGIYKIKVLETINFANDLIIKGIEDKCGFTILNNTPLFSSNINHLNIDIDKISILNSNANDVAKLFVFDNKTIKLTSVRIENCEFIGNLWCFSYVGDITLNPDEVDYGINEFIFKYNKIKNCRGSFVRLNDIPHFLVDIEYNEVENWDYTLFYVGRTAGHSYRDAIMKSKKDIIIKHNRAFCTDDWWHNVDYTGSYFTFAVALSQKLIYEFNHVEGMKSKKDLGMYDIYSNSENVYYKNNTFKNNVIFDISVENSHRILMKAKSGMGVRVYKDNKFIVEEDFIIKNGGNPLELNFKLYDINDETEEWNIDGNEINVPFISLQTSTNILHRFKFFNNIIKAKKIINFLVASSYESCDVYIKDNTFNIDDKTSYFSLVRSFTDTFYNNVIISNNNILGYINYPLYTVNCRKLLLDNNYLESNNSSNTGVTLISGGFYDEIIISNLKLKSNNQTRLFNSAQIMDVSISFNTVTSQYKDSGGFYNLKYFKDYNNVLSDKLYYVLELELLTKSTKYVGKASFEVSSEGGKNYIAFIDKTTSLQAKYIISSFNDVSNGEGNNKNVKFDNEMPYNLNFVNKPNDSYLQLLTNTFTESVVMNIRFSKL